MAALFHELSTEFGAAWDTRLQTREAMELAKNSWWQQIHDLTPDEIRTALGRLDVGVGKFPPGPRAFRQIALANSRRGWL